ncbi:MAG: phage holin family protein [Bacillota bacterium]
MRRTFWWRVLVNAVALWLIARWLVPGLEFSSDLAILVAGAVLGVVNTLVRPLFIILSLPLNLLTLGLFTFIINGIMLHITAWLSPGFAVHGFWTGVWAAMLLSLFGAIVNRITD